MIRRIFGAACEYDFETRLRYGKGFYEKLDEPSLVKCIEFMK
jgi:hypothetical protein